MVDPGESRSLTSATAKPDFKKNPPKVPVQSLMFRKTTCLVSGFTWSKRSCTQHASGASNSAGRVKEQSGFSEKDTFTSTGRPSESSPAKEIT